VACGEREALGFADVLRDHVASLNLSPEQGKVAAHILACRTGRLGGHAFVCDRCGGRHYAFNSCRDRHCPRCGGLDQAIWAEAQQQHLLPLTYFHLVFTIPASLRPFFLGKGRAHALEALFAAASETILDVGARKGIRLGVLAVLHTWNQLLDNHPHIHCLVPGGGFGKNGFVVMKRFLFSYKLLREVFKIKLLQKLRALLKEDVLTIGKSSAYQLLKDADSREWNMKVKRAMAGPDAVIKYFARYTKRIALAESRIVAYDGRTVTFRFRDRQDGNRVKTRKLDAPTFCQRFMNHVLPPGFVRIRRTGFWSNRSRKQMLEEARKALKADTPPAPTPESRWDACLRIFGKDPSRCRKCPDGRLVMIASWTATKLPIEAVLDNLLPRAP
jgi:hypothetical protein